MTESQPLTSSDGGTIEEKDCLRDLGVRVSTDLTFSIQIDMVVESGSRMAGWALRTFRRRGRNSGSVPVSGRIIWFRSYPTTS